MEVESGSQSVLVMDILYIMSREERQLPKVEAVSVMCCRFLDMLTTRQQGVLKQRWLVLGW